LFAFLAIAAEFAGSIGLITGFLSRVSAFGLGVFASKVDGSDNVVGVPGRDRVFTRRGEPSVHPSNRLRRSRLIGYIERVLQAFDNFLAGRTAGLSLAGR
jgi:hypothetical protein